MSKRTPVALEPAFILHRRPYRDTSLLLDVFTQTHGRISLIARGVRGPRSKLQSLLQPFVPLLISWQGKSELMFFISAEVNGSYPSLKGDSLLSAFYLNELLVRVLQKEDPHPVLFSHYKITLIHLQNHFAEKTLRLFEKKCLEELGYGLQFEEDFSTKKALMADHHYQFYPDKGFAQCKKDQLEGLIFSGKSLLDFKKEAWNDATSLLDAKRLMRFAFSALLGVDLLHSRQLFSYKKPKIKSDDFA